jgi:hypothetical protein
MGGDIPRVTRDLPRGRSKGPKMDFEALIVDRPEGREFIAQTANGTAKWKGTGWNRSWDYDRPELPPDLTRPAGRTSRTGE